MTQRLVANTGPLIAFASIDRLDILRALFASVHIPQAVHAEIMQGGAEHRGVAAYRRANWITVMPSVLVDPLLSTVLDPGEAAVIALARLQNAV